MFRSNHDPLENSHAPSTMPVSVPPAEVAPVTPSWSAYLDALVAPLGFLPAEQRQSIRTEYGQHLDSLYAAHIELGASHEEAVARSLATFGDVKTHSKQLAREWRTQQRWRSFPVALRFGVQVVSGATLRDYLIGAGYIFTTELFGVGINDRVLGVELYYGAWVAFCTGWLMLISPFLVGIRLRRETGKLALPVGLLSTVATTLVFLLVYGCVKLVLEFIGAGSTFLSNRLPDLLAIGTMYQAIRLPFLLLGIGIEHYRQRRRRAIG